ncbi:MAG TPA: hypothetical protein VF449_09760 [Parvibaculum sp.]
MKSVVFAVAVSLGAVFAAAPAFAASMEARFGNTMLATRPDGTTIKMYYNKDHSFTGEMAPGGSQAVYEAKGTWRLSGDKLCVTPAGGTAEHKAPEVCAPLKGSRVGDKWQSEVPTPDGKTVVQTVEIVKGR